MHILLTTYIYYNYANRRNMPPETVTPSMIKAKLAYFPNLVVSNAEQRKI